MAPRQPRSVNGPVSNRLAVETTIGALRELGRVEQVDAAVIVAAQALADAVDRNPEHASLWLQYQRALETLRSVGADAGDSALDQLLDQLRTPVGDPEVPKAKVTRRRDRSGR